MKNISSKSSNVDLSKSFFCFWRKKFVLLIGENIEEKFAHPNKKEFGKKNYFDEKRIVDDLENVENYVRDEMSDVGRRSSMIIEVENLDQQPSFELTGREKCTDTVSTMVTATGNCHALVKKKGDMGA